MSSVATPPIDFTQPGNVKHELLDPDQNVRDDYARHLDPELDLLAQALAAAFEAFPAILEVAARIPTPRTGMVAGFAFGVIDDIVVATKLLLAGKGPASGNTIRQAIEGVAMAVLCSTDMPLILQKKAGKATPRIACYWQKLDQGDPATQGHHALKQLDWNARTLQVSADAIQSLRKAQQHYHQFSHCGPVTIGLRHMLDGPVIPPFSTGFRSRN
ncbi:hypothetical protein WT81_11230 [Burkholderia stagnalis]|uniref:hypothetical protein n=1 Tax=Burkholderia stagnalis TaxID=1503054 RepID=UPI00075FE2EE|nr:hypothetical protein [Burkholderia stagnalis]KWK50028.1 hypothetical protein WT80_13840 [Burkholderia stagnalis]KWK60989.1 hypothetical protein WT81_11230 [Burkholderia stagnalis]